MKIAMLAPGGFDRSGTARVIPCLLWMVERLVKWGDEVHVFVLRQETRPGQWPLLGASVHNAGGANPLVRGSRTLRTLRQEHRRAPFDVIHAFWAVPQGILAGVAALGLRIPVLLHLPGGDLACLPDIAYGARTTMKRRLALRLAILAADRIAVPSGWMVEEAGRLGIRAERLPFGVALDRWPVAAPRRRSSSAPAKLLQVANLNPVKDQETLLAAAAHLKDRGIPFLLDIVGEDTMQGKAQRRAQELGLGHNVHFRGFLPQSTLRDYVYAADLLVVPSRHEAGPIVALEAAAAGVPVVGTRVGLLADWSPEAARTVDIGDSAALANLIADLLSNEDQRLLLASEAQKRAIAENADVTTRAIRNAYLAMQKRRK
ncbi:MAG TPA: glycosyltransferase family 4 protein [Rhizomicrobium sp.]|nr:glycosyltransferase family 4 protein [Rhizomicrobium sp.]